MLVTINGRERDIPAGQNITQLLDSLALPPQRVAVEVNGAIVPRPDYAATPLTEGDRLEIVQFVGGG